MVYINRKGEEMRTKIDHTKSWCTVKSGLMEAHAMGTMEEEEVNEKKEEAISPRGRAWTRHKLRKENNSKKEVWMKTRRKRYKMLRRVRGKENSR